MTIKDVDILVDQAMEKLQDGEISLRDFAKSMGLDPDKLSEFDWQQINMSLYRYRSDVYHLTQKSEGFEMKETPYNDGWIAFTKGLTRSDYPAYDDFSDECQWVDGWDDAKKKDAQMKDIDTLLEPVKKNGMNY